jgi:arylsulfatase A-like enzyme
MLRLLCAVFVTAASSLAADKPNILFIMADDVGYGDLSCYGAKHAKTPNLDRLAKEGCKLTDAHSPASTCTPTRRALLTGTYSWRQQPASGILPGDAPLGITPGTATLPSLLKQAGYITGIVGKWHLGLGPEGGPDWNGDIKPGPTELGFDYTYIMAATGDRVPTVYIEGNRIVGLDPKDPIQVSYKAKVGTEATGRENPDQLKLKHTHGHDMTIVNGVGRIGWMAGGKTARWRDEDMADSFAKKAVGFIERAAEKKDQPFFLYFATHGIHVPRVPNERFKGVSGHGTRADAIHELDDTVGQVFAALEKQGLMDKTLVIFTSDNGGVMDDGYEDFAPGDYPMNAPLRGTKGTLFEGGHRVPFLARWPGKIKPATVSPALIAHLDMPATFATLTGTALPKDGCLDSVNVLPALLGESQKGREQFIAHTGGIKGPLTVRDGNWKFIQPGGGNYGKAAKGGETKPSPKGLLYNLASDPAEQNNLAEQLPDRVKELSELIQKTRAAGRTRE